MGKKQTGTKNAKKKLGVKRDTLKKLSSIDKKDLGQAAGGAATVSRTCAWGG